MRFTDLLDWLAHPAGTVIRIAFLKEGMDADKLVTTSPRTFMEKLAEVCQKELDYARLFVYLVASALKAKGVRVSPEEWLKAFESDDAGYVVDWLEKLESVVACQR